MGHRLPEDVRRGTRLDERLQDPCVLGGVRARGELAIGEGASAACTELDVALRVELAGCGELRHVAAALLGRGAALDEDGRHARLRQAERGKQACGARAHNDGARDRMAGLELGRLVEGLLGKHDVVGRQACDEALLASGALVQRSAHARDIVDVAALAGIDGATGHAAGVDVGDVDAQLAAHGQAEQIGVIGDACRLATGKGELEVAYLDHRRSL